MYIVVDVESDGPCPHLYSMISFGAIVVDEELDKSFYGKLYPISDNYIPDALAVSGVSREETLKFDNPEGVMFEFKDWINKVRGNERVYFISDNNGFDWQFINYYFHRYCGENPFGFSSTNLGSLYKGFIKDMFKNFKHLRRTKHTHHPVDDARGNAEALLEIKKRGLKIKL